MGSAHQSSENSSTNAVTSAVTASEGWCVVIGKVRIDSFNQNLLIETLNQARSVGHQRIAIDLNPTRFLSLSAIQFLVQFAKGLSEAGGAFALIAPSEKTKRHFEIYGSLAHIGIFRAGQTVPTATRLELGTGAQASPYTQTTEADH